MKNNKGMYSILYFIKIFIHKKLLHFQSFLILFDTKCLSIFSAFTFSTFISAFMIALLIFYKKYRKGQSLSFQFHNTHHKLKSHNVTNKEFTL